MGSMKGNQILINFEFFSHNTQLKIIRKEPYKCSKNKKVVMKISQNFILKHVIVSLNPHYITTIFFQRDLIVKQFVIAMNKMAL